ncbi:MAG: haloacid dehalogenase type II [Rhodospirillaceae bacterium]|nr:haloacid dehalogenase type II [Rhodospirillaceae bacterium]MDG1274287.1 haloacid dehalogenase type II [Alphaproteobacteria bacterium]MDG1888079.1 haloacid dehalogenase type II [Alphaproteobacteria bacterium]|tara:strand:- start:4338 stop:5051 length:714 start_codon:yes stop_codon:yes gene_type:complete
MDVNNIKALVFDVFGTVVDWRTSIASEAKQCLSKKGYELDWVLFADSWRAKYQPAMERVRTGGRGFVRLDILHMENLIEVLKDFDIKSVTETELNYLNRAWHRLLPWSDSVPGLLRLKKKFIIGTMSNGNVALMVNMAKNGGLPWDVILGAEPAQAYKPEPKTYLTGVDWLNLKPSEVLMCAAHNADLVAAGAQGLKTAFIARPTEYGPNQKHDFEAEHDFDYISENMLDLADKLGC